MGTVAKFKTALTSRKGLQEDFYKVSFENCPINALTGTDEFDLWCQAATIPGRQLSVLEIKKHNFTIRMPDRMTYDGKWSVTVLLDLNLTTYKWLLKWQEYYSNFKNDIGGERGFPTGTAIVTTLDNKFEENTQVKPFKIFGIFPSNVPNVEFKQDSSGYLNPQVEFTYSYCSNGDSINDPLT